MSTPAREDVYKALFALVTPLLAPGAVDGPPDGQALSGTGTAARPGSPNAARPFNLITRTVIEPQRVPVNLQPVLMQYEMDEQNVYSGRSLVKKVWTVVYIIGATHPRGSPGVSGLNPLIDLVESCFLPDKFEDTITLAGKVAEVQLVGLGGKDHGDNSTKSDARQSVYYLPVQITLPVS